MDRIKAFKSAESQTHKIALERKLRELSGTSYRREELQIEPVADPLDQLTTNVDRDITVYELDYRTRAVRDVQAALAKMEAGGYGECEECGEPIATKRLAAVPWARLCIACQSRAESSAESTTPIQFDKAA